MAAPNVLPNSHGFPSPRYLEGWVEGWKPNEADFIGPSILPVENHFFDSVEYDELAAVAGMLPAHALGTAPQELTQRARKTRVLQPFYFGGSYKYHEQDFLRIRALGQYNVLAGRQMIDLNNETMAAMLSARREWSRWRAMQGSLSISENGVIRTVTYPVTSISSPSTLWTNLASSDPIANIQAWALLFRGKGSGRLRVHFNKQVAGLLSNNASVQAKISGNVLAANQGTENITAALRILVGDVDFVCYDGGVLDDNNVYQPFIPDNTVMLMMPPPNGQKVGAWKTTISTQNGGYATPRPGMFSWVDDKTSNAKVPYYEHGIGQYGVPVLYFPDNFASVVIGS